MTIPDTAQQPAPSGPRTGPIIWGSIILLFCGIVAQRLFGGASLGDGWWLIAVIIGLGVLLLVVGVTVLLRGRNN